MFLFLICMCCSFLVTSKADTVDKSENATVIPMSPNVTSVTSKTDTLDYSENVPIIPMSPNVMGVMKNSRVIIDCKIEFKSANVTFMWSKDGIIIETNRRVYIATNGSLIIERFLKKKDKLRDDSGLYICYATDSHGTFIGRHVQVNNTRPKLIIEPEKINVVVGGVARLQCRFDAYPSTQPFYIWEHSEQNIGNDRMKIYYNMGVLQIHNVTAANEGRYICTDDNSEDNYIEKIAYLSVHSGQISSIPKLLNTPTHITVPQGKPALLECLVQGGTNTKITWLYSDGVQVLSGADERRLLSGRLNIQFSVALESDSGIYRCVVTDSNGFKKTRDYLLEVLTPPKFTETPKSFLRVLTGIIRLNCLAVGKPAPTVQWYKDGFQLFPSPGLKIDNQLVLFGMYEDSGYYQCVANNSMGVQIATSWVKVTVKENVPKVVTNLTVTPISAHKVNVTWAPVAPDAESLYTGCFVDFRIIHDIECPGRCKFLIKRDRDVSNNHHHVLKDLKPFTEYSVAVQCVSGTGAGMMSEPVIVRTLESVPTAVPEVEVQPHTSRSFRVIWHEIPEADRHGIISKYKLTYKYTRKDHVLTVMEFPADTREYLVRGLIPNTTYIVKVLAGNTAGYPDSDDNWVTARTLMSFQDGNHLTSLTLIPINVTTVIIKWLPLVNSSVGAYRLLVTEHCEKYVVIEVDVSSDESNFTVTGLEHRHFYDIELMITDKNGASLGYVSVTELYQSNKPGDVVQPPPPVYLNSVTSSSTKITLSWQAPKTKLKIVGYTVRYHRSGSNPDDTDQYINSTSTYVTLRNLQPFTWYACAVNTYTASTEGPYCQDVKIQTSEGLPSPPENLFAVVVSPGTVKLKWHPPRQQNGILIFYVIYYNDVQNVPDKAWSSIHQNASTTSVILKDLTNDVYYFKLKACTNAGEGTSSNVIRIENLDCEKCPKCTHSDIDCRKTGGPVETGNSDSDNMFQQKLGIIIGCGVGAVCVVISVMYVLYKQRQLRARYLNQPRTELLQRAQYNGRAVHLVPAPEVPSNAEPVACSPMLQRMLENTDFTYSKIEQTALLSHSSSGSVNHQTTNTSLGSSDSDLTTTTSAQQQQQHMNGPES